MSEEELFSKFMGNATAVLKAATAKRLYGALASIEKARDVRTLAKMLLVREGS